MADAATETDRVNHVVTGADNSVLDGFTVASGMADGPASDDEDGGGMYNDYASPTVRNCIFYNNYALNFGGGMYNYENHGVVENSIFWTNVSSNRGGGMFTNESDLSITNCDFVNNSANNLSNTGGGLYDYSYSHVVVTNSIFWDNQPDQIYSDSSSYPVDVSYCLVEGGYTAGTNIVTADPLFVDETSGDFRLTDTSPCIDAADGTAATAEDIADSARVDVPWVADTGIGPPWADIGAFEYSGEEPVWITMIGGGTFDMGSAAGDADELPVHPVSMTGFDMTMFEVTMSQYTACVDAGGCSDPDVGGSCNWGITGLEFHPVNCVSWQQAVDYCTWVDAGGRLPTEAEWEYAARSQGASNIYPWGAASPVPDYHAAMSGSACGTCPVCNTPDGNTSTGLCDMAGNVWEWTEDWYHSSYTGAPNDGSAWVIPPGTQRVMRGGSWGNAAWDLRTTNRAYYNPVGYAYLGFRCVR